MEKRIFGFIGMIASGKDTTADYLVKNYQAQQIKFSSSLTDVLKRLYIPTARENYQVLSKSLRENFGQDLFSKIVASDVNSATANIVVVDGVRRPMDIENLKNIPGFKLVAIDVDAQTRFERIKNRKEKQDDATKTWEEFQAEDKAESEIAIPDLMQQADIKIDNNGSVEDLYKQLDELIYPVK